MRTRLALTAIISACLLPPAATAQYVVENLGRGLIAIRASETTVYVGWRLLGTDPADVAFNVYRASGSGAAVKLNPAPLTATASTKSSSSGIPRIRATTLPQVFPAGS